MEDEILSSESAETEGIVDLQTDVTTSTEQVQEQSVNSEVADTKPVQTAEENSQFAKVRRETEMKAKDTLIAEMYGESHGIRTYAEYQKAIADQKAEEQRQQFQEKNGFDPDTVKPLFEEWKKSDPDFQELSHIRQEKNITAALSDLNNELKDCGIDLQLKNLSDEEVTKIPNADKVTELVSKGKTLSEAFFLANKKDIISKQTQAAQQETLRKIADNKASSPGSLSGGGDNVATFTMEQIQKMSQEQINQNYEAVMASYKKLRG